MAPDFSYHINRVFFFWFFLTIRVYTPQPRVAKRRINRNDLKVLQNTAKMLNMYPTMRQKSLIQLN